MCGRTACTLAPDELCNACSSKSFHVEWRDHPGANGTYFTSYNVAPTSYTPVIFNGDILRTLLKIEPENEYIMQPMMWNLIPHFYKGDNPKNHGFKTNNCRVEGMASKPMFSHLLKKGQRCVVLCDGFYEWQTVTENNSKIKIPHLIHAPQPEHVKLWDRSSWENINSNSTDWNGPTPLKMAGLFSRWVSVDGNEVWSYCVLTMEAGKGFSWLHHRVPVILEREQDVKDWLDPDVSVDTVLASVSSSPNVSTYVVSTAVNNSRNNTVDCMKPQSTFPASNAKKDSSSGSRKLMSSWLSKGTTIKRPAKDDDKVPDIQVKEKKSKLV